MNSNRAPNGSPEPAQERSPRASRAAVIVVAVSCLLACLGALVWLMQPNPATTDEATPPADAPSADGVLKPKSFARLRAPGEADGAAAPAEPAALSSPPAVVAPPPQPPPVATGPVDPAMSSLVSGLLLRGGTSALTTEGVQAWKTNYQQLVQSGAAAMPALRAFLAENQDTVFDTETARALGQRSARLAAFDALQQIGGPEAIALLEQTLGETKAPREIAALAWNLEDMAAGQYREKILAAARSVLGQTSPVVSSGTDVAPLFEVFQKYGDASLVPELEQATGRWKYYATAALANLPDSAGVPVLLRMADPAANSGNRLAALEALTGLAAQNADARTFIIGQVGGKQIPANFWPYLSARLAGEQTYPADGVLTKYPNVQSWSDIKTTKIVYGNQNFYTLPGEAVQTAEGISQQLTLLDQLTSLGGGPESQQALQQARDRLNQRLARLATAPPPK